MQVALDVLSTRFEIAPSGDDESYSNKSSLSHSNILSAHQTQLRGLSRPLRGLDGQDLSCCGRDAHCCAPSGVFDGKAYARCAAFHRRYILWNMLPGPVAGACVPLSCSLGPPPSLH